MPHPSFDPGARPGRRLSDLARRNGLLGAAAALLLLLAIAGRDRIGGRASGEATSKYDVGPRAIEDPTDTALAAVGAQVFVTRNCMSCHVQSAGRSSPDLANGVSRRRTAEWLEQFMLHPEVMVREDPIGRELIHEYTIQMPNFDLSPEEARALVEYFKLQDRGRAPSTASAR